MWKSGKNILYKKCLQHANRHKNKWTFIAHSCVLLLTCRVEKYTVLIQYVLHTGCNNFICGSLNTKALLGGGLGCRDASSVNSSPMLQVNSPILHDPSPCYPLTRPLGHTPPVPYILRYVNKQKMTLSHLKKSEFG